MELIEQPVAAYDLEGLRDVTGQTSTLIVADQSLLSARAAEKFLKMRAVGVLNIKLMKSGGIREVLKINAMAEANGIGFMVGSVMEPAVGIRFPGQYLKLGKEQGLEFDWKRLMKWVKEHACE